MRRREFIEGLGSVAVIPPWVAFAQQNDRLRRVDVVLAEVGDDPYIEARLAALTDALRGLGWIDGRNLRLAVHRVTPNASDIRRVVTELLSARPDVVVSGGATTTGPLLQATTSVPVVFISVVDPVGAGFVESLAQPGGNVTGFNAVRLQSEWQVAGAFEASRARYHPRRRHPRPGHIIRYRSIRGNPVDIKFSRHRRRSNQPARCG